MTTDRFHKAAKDGYIDVLKEATRSDCNGKDEQGMTPTLYAAFYGHLDALRLLCGRGGNPDKSDYFGNTALHLAAAQGHKAVVTFLVNFGANIHALDIDERTPKELAGINSRDDIMVYLDNIAAKLESTDKKKSKEMKERAKKDAEKKIKKFNKHQTKLQTSEKLQKKPSKESKIFSTLRNRIKSSGSMSNLSNAGVTYASAPRNSFSALVSGTGTTRGVTSAVQKKALARQHRIAESDPDDFKISEIEDGKRSVRSLKGFRPNSEILYTGQVENARRGRLDDVFNGNDGSPGNGTDEADEPGTLTRSLSQPNFMHELNNNENSEPASIFVRPGIGSLAFRKSITNTLQAMSMAEAAVMEASSIGSAGSLAARQRHNGRPAFDEDFTDPETSDDEDECNPLERFLTAWGLAEYLPKFEEQKIDLVSLILLTEDDLKSLNLPLGPHRVLVTAVNERKNALQNPGEVVDSRL